jgi:hypothetical protein
VKKVFPADFREIFRRSIEINHHGFFHLSAAAERKKKKNLARRRKGAKPGPQHSG